MVQCQRLLKLPPHPLDKQTRRNRSRIRPHHWISPRRASNNHRRIPYSVAWHTSDNALRTLVTIRLTSGPAHSASRPETHSVRCLSPPASALRSTTTHKHRRILESTRAG